MFTIIYQSHSPTTHAPRGKEPSLPSLGGGGQRGERRKVGGITPGRGEAGRGRPCLSGPAGAVLVRHASTSLAHSRRVVSQLYVWHDVRCPVSTVWQQWVMRFIVLPRNSAWLLGMACVRVGRFGGERGIMISGYGAACGSCKGRRAILFGLGDGVTANTVTILPRRPRYKVLGGWA